MVAVLVKSSSPRVGFAIFVQVQNINPMDYCQLSPIDKSVYCPNIKWVVMELVRDQIDKKNLCGISNSTFLDQFFR